MDPPAPPPDQVRGTQVGGGELPVFLSLEHSEQSPSKGVNNTENNASLTKRKDGSIRLALLEKKAMTFGEQDNRINLNFETLKIRRPLGATRL